MLHPTDLDIRTQEHNRRVDSVNRYGWQRANPIRPGRSMTAGAVLAAVATRLSLSSPVREDRGIDTSQDGAVTGNAALGAA